MSDTESIVETQRRAAQRRKETPPELPSFGEVRARVMTEQLPPYPPKKPEQDTDEERQYCRRCGEPLYCPCMGSNGT